MSVVHPISISNSSTLLVFGYLLKWQWIFSCYQHTPYVFNEYGSMRIEVYLVAHKHRPTAIKHKTSTPSMETSHGHSAISIVPNKVIRIVSQNGHCVSPLNLANEWLLCLSNRRQLQKRPSRIANENEPGQSEIAITKQSVSQVNRTNGRVAQRQINKMNTW